MPGATTHSGTVVQVLEKDGGVAKEHSRSKSHQEICRSLIRPHDADQLHVRHVSYIKSDQILVEPDSASNSISTLTLSGQ